MVCNASPGAGTLAQWGRLPAVHSDGVIACLLLLFLYSRNEIDHAFALSRNPNLRPAVEVELAHHADLLFLAGQGLRWEKGLSAAWSQTPPTNHTGAWSPPWAFVATNDPS